MPTHSPEVAIAEARAGSRAEARARRRTTLCLAFKLWRRGRGRVVRRIVVADDDGALLGVHEGLDGLEEMKEKDVYRKSTQKAAFW
jgi:hypothetical protein